MIINILLTLIFTWLILLSFFLIKIIKDINSILKGHKNQNIIDILSTVIRNQTHTQKEIQSIIKREDKFEEMSLSYFYRIGLVRFNPFSDTGGEQSFILALLDRKNSGIVISGLYARSGMRWYIKRVKEGEGIEHELSEEEKKAVENAK